MNYDNISSTKDLPRVNTAKYQQDPKEEWLTCFEPVPIDFLNKVDTALTEIESFIKKTHRGKFTFEDVAADSTLKCILITVKAPNSKQTLWIMRENESECCFYIYCKTLFEVSSMDIHLYVSICNK
jgi:hypothetical protein